MLQAPPFTILAIGEFGPVQSPARLVPVDLAGLDDAVAAAGVCLNVPLPRDVCPAGAAEFRPIALRDFRPAGLVRRVPCLVRLGEGLAFLSEAIAGRIAPSTVAAEFRQRWPELPLDDRTPPAAAPAVPPAERQRYNAIDDILSMVATPASPGPAAGIGPAQWHAALEQRLIRAQAAIFADPAFRACEAVWRGVETVVRFGPVRDANAIRMYLASATADSLGDALDGLSGLLAEEPPNLILIDVPFDASPASQDRLERVAAFAESLLAPAAVWVTARFFGLSDWSGLGRLPYLDHFLEDAAYARWRGFRGEPAAAWLAVLCNRFLGRPRHGEDEPPGTPSFREPDPLWVSPVWALGTLVAQSVARYGWPSRFTDYVNIALEDLAVIDVGGGELSATESLLSMDRLRQFNEAGFVPLTPIGRADSAGVPRETTLAGAPLKAQLFLSRVVGFLLKLRESVGRETGEAEPEALVADALRRMFDQTGHNPPEDLAVRAAASSPGERVPLWISFTPPPSVLHSKQPVELTFMW